jgi:hypothetical protein
MKALPPAPSQLELLPRRSVLALSVVEQSARHEILRALAEILLHAAEAAARKDERDERG